MWTACRAGANPAYVRYASCLYSQWMCHGGTRFRLIDVSHSVAVPEEVKTRSFQQDRSSAASMSTQVYSRAEEAHPVSKYTSQNA
jgi:hypothetical protein